MSNADDMAVALLADALAIDRCAVHAGTALGATPQWDSLAHMRLILALEERLGRQLDPESIVGIAGMQDVVAVIAAHSPASGD